MRISGLNSGPDDVERLMPFALRARAPVAAYMLWMHRGDDEDIATTCESKNSCG